MDEEQEESLVDLIPAWPNTTRWRLRADPTRIVQASWSMRGKPFVLASDEGTVGKAETIHQQLFVYCFRPEPLSTGEALTCLERLGCDLDPIVHASMETTPEELRHVLCEEWPGDGPRAGDVEIIWRGGALIPVTYHGTLATMVEERLDPAGYAGRQQAETGHRCPHCGGEL